jgi:hypothetical protein
MNKYVIRRREEETECCWCGFPLEIGDKGIEKDNKAYCSESCAAADDPEDDDQ